MFFRVIRDCRVAQGNGVGRHGSKACPELAEGCRKRGPPIPKINQRDKLTLAERIELSASLNYPSRRLVQGNENRSVGSLGPKLLVVWASGIRFVSWRNDLHGNRKSEIGAN